MAPTPEQELPICGSNLGGGGFTPPKFGGLGGQNDSVSISYSEYKEQFPQAAAEWDLERLYQNLGDAKREVASYRRRGLTDTEKCHLRGLLCQFSPDEIAKILYKNPKGVRVDLSKTLYRYVEKLTGRQRNTLKNWRDVIDWLAAAGYKLPQPTQTYIDSLVKKLRNHCYNNIQRHCGKMQLLDISQPVDIDLFYVEVNILEDIPSQEWVDISDLVKELELGRVRQAGIPGFEAVEKYSRLMVVGKPGAGKTTFLQYLAIQCNKGNLRSDLVPIFITLKDFAKYSRDEEDLRLLNYINRQLQPELRRIAEPNVMEIVLSEGRGLILLDGLDEVPEGNELEICEAINNFCDRYHQNKFIITCRIAGSNFRFSSFVDVEIADFNERQIESFVRKWFINIPRNNQGNEQAKAKEFIKQLNLPENQRIRELAVTPLWLHLTCLVFKAKGEFPCNPANLYQQGLKIMLVEWNEAKGIRRDEVYRNLSVYRKKELLSHIAAVTFTQGDYFFEQNKIQRIVIDYLRTLPEQNIETHQLQEDSEAILKSIELQHGLLVERANGIYSFSNLTVQEYLTAMKIVNSLEEEPKIAPLEELVEKIGEKRWREVFLLVASMLDCPNILLQLMKNKVDKLVAEDKNLQEFLGWVNQKSRSISIPDNYNPAAFRVFYFVLDRILDDALNRPLTPLNNSALNSVLDYAINHALKHEINPIFYLALNRALVHGIVSAIEPGILRAFIRSLDPELRQILEQLKEQFLHGNYNNKALTDEFTRMMISHRYIGDDWQFSQEQKELLRQYYDANKLLVDCLNSGCNVSGEVRREIEDTLLLPLAEIKNRGGLLAIIAY